MIFNTAYREILPNGLTIIIQEKNTRSAAIAAGVRFGTAHHPLAHFIGHMLFKGTERRTYQDINREAIMGGGSMDEITNLYSTIFFAKTVPNHVYQILDLLCDMIKNSVFSANEIKYEKLVVANELIGRNENPRVILKEILYGNLHKIAAAHTQDKNFLDDFSPAQIFDIYRQSYVPEKLVIAIVGKIKRIRALKIIKEYFEHLESGYVHDPPSPPTKNPVSQTKTSNRIVVRKRGLEHTHLMIGFKVPSIPHNDYYPLLALQTIIAGNIASRLFEELRERRGLLYNITAKLDCSSEHGIFNLYTNFSRTNLQAIETIIKKEFKKLRSNPVSEEELTIAKLKVTRGRQLATEGTFQHARLLVEAEINNCFNDPQHFYARVNEIKTKDILRVAKRYCTINKSLTVILKPCTQRTAQ